ncbi:hypothetical protein SAMN05421796_1062 [Chryseobacterium piscicola]|uniref:Uncharacterized protein n=1 Tax=Chryseobacterium piscicola TaxID=551459 RepID=A0A1N7MX31_9FLAO|nr:hypothetical protein [Chryseobacterium piscicola]PQA93919.1 hypothetical protein B0A70_09040 [Chryseobacterium piscicola]SIS90714.1 hypothetical protein SAMN05421796_1062 [Chryseobacterium piscicola]
MSICKFCQINDANKKNTHYLTDAIIRSCLNIEGSNNREKGLYFAINSKNPFIEFNFQRLDEHTIENAIGRKPTDEEIENAKRIPFSVDYIFCSDCERKFTDIETKFIEKVLPKFRQDDLTNLNSISISDNLICRNFFYLQIFRSTICEEVFDLPKDFVDKLRKILFENIEDYTIPLSVTYLQTTGGQENYTENYVGYTSDKNPFIIFMNDFIVQCYDRNENIKHLELYGLNNDNYNDFININEEEFIFNIFQNDERKAFLSNLITNEKVKQTIINFENYFDEIWIRLFGTKAPSYQKEKYIKSVANQSQEKLNSLSQEEMYNFTFSYLTKLLNIKE